MRGRSPIGFVVLLIIFVVLLLFVLSKGKSKQKVYEEHQAEKETLVYPDFDPDAVAHLTLSSLQGGVIDFKKMGGYWMVAD